MQHHSKQWCGCGTEVMHVHFHVIPKSSEFGLRKQWTPRPLADGEAEEILHHASIGRAGINHHRNKKGGLQEAAFLIWVKIPLLDQPCFSAIAA